MAFNAVTKNTTGSVLRYGYCDFTTDGSYNPGVETQVSLNEGAVPVSGIPLRYNKIDSGNFAEMTTPEKNAVDAELLQDYKTERTKEVDAKTALIRAAGFEETPSSGEYYSLAQEKLSELRDLAENGAFPIVWDSVDGLDALNFTNLGLVAAFLAQCRNALKVVMQSGEDLKAQMRAAPDKATLDAIYDTRPIPYFPISSVCVLVTSASGAVNVTELTVDAGGTIVWNWGDGSEPTVYGAGTHTPSHTYTDSLPSHAIVLNGDLNKVSVLNANSCSLVLGDVSVLTMLTSLAVANNSLTAIGDLSGLTSLVYLHVGNNSLTDIGDLSALTSLGYLAVSNNSLTDIGDLAALTSLVYLHVHDNSLTDIGDLSALTSLATLNVYDNGMSQAVVDAMLEDIADTVGSRPTSGVYMDFSGTNSAPSQPGGCDDYDAIVAARPAWTVTVTGGCL